MLEVHVLLKMTIKGKLHEQGKCIVFCFVIYFACSCTLCYYNTYSWYIQVYLDIPQTQSTLLQTVMLGFVNMHGFERLNVANIFVNCHPYN